MPLVTPNMGLTEPGIGNTTSPAWAALINANFGLIDQHDHTPGKGVAISSGSINVNADFSFNGFNLLAVNSLDFSGAVTGTPSTLSIYSNGTDFFFKDVNGNSIQLTKSGGPNAGTGNIQNLPSTPNGGAGISWANTQSTFQFFADDGTSASSIDVATVIVRYPGSYPTPAGNFIALEAPSSLASAYALVLPSLPPGQQIMTLDNAGNIAAPYTVDNSTIAITANVIGVKALGINTAQLADGAVTKPKQAAVGQQLSSAIVFAQALGTASTAIGSVTITTTGRPVVLALISSGAAAESSIDVGNQGGTFAEVNSTFNIQRDSGVIYFNKLGASLSPGHRISVPPGSLWQLDVPSAGSHTYHFSMQGLGGASVTEVNNVIIMAYEL